MALSSSERNAFIKATKIRGWESVRRMEYGRYLVKSASSEATYVVTGTDRMGRDHTCSCQAALSGRFCWHRAAVVLARQRYEWTKAKAAQVVAQPVAVTISEYDHDIDVDGYRSLAEKKQAAAAAAGVPMTLNLPNGGPYEYVGGSWRVALV